MDQSRFRSVLERSRDQPRNCFVALWREARRPGALHGLVEAHRADAKGFDECEAAYSDWLRGESASLPDVPREWLLAALRALDRHLHLLEEADRAEHGFLPQHVTSEMLELDGAGGAEEEYWVVRRTFARQGRGSVESQPLFLQAWVREHWVIPRICEGIEVHVGLCGSGLRRRLAEVGGGAELKVGVASFEGDSELRVDVPREGFFVIPGLEEEGLREAAIDSVLDQAIESAVQILVLPELTVTPSLRTKLAARLHRESTGSLELVLAGSFHESDGALGWVNLATLLRADGRRVLQQKKRMWLGWLDEEGQPKNAEDIQGARKIRVLWTPLGLLVIPICLDFGQKAEGMDRFWARLGPQLALVPSMGADSTVSMHRRRAGDLVGEHRAIVAVANQGPPGFPFRTADLPRGEREPVGGFVAPGPGGDKLAGQWVEDRVPNGAGGCLFVGRAPLDP